MDIDKAKSTRRYAKSVLTRHINALSRKVTEGDIPRVDAQLIKCREAYDTFENSHFEYHELLEDESELEVSDTYYADQYELYMDELRAANDWLKLAKDSEVKTPVSPPVSSPESLATELVNLLDVPKVDIPVFSGDPKDYQSFIAIFNDSVGKRNIDDGAKLTRLIQYTDGRARSAIKNCVLIKDGKVAYEKALNTLENRFGNIHLVTQSIIKDLKHGKPAIKPADLRQLADDLSMAHSVLDDMGAYGEINTQQSIIDILQRCHSSVRNRWRKKALKLKLSRNGDYPDFEQFVEFIDYVSAEACDPVYGIEAKVVAKTVSNNLTAEQASATNVSQYQCLFCEGKHNLNSCVKFKDMRPPQKRLDFVKSKRLCFSCLSRDHRIQNCPQKVVCGVNGCTSKHSKLIHMRESNSQDQSLANDQSSKITPSSCAYSMSEINVYLPIVPIKVNGHDNVVYALLDSGSTNTLITEHLQSKLGLAGKTVSCQMRTVGSCSNVNTRLVSFHASSLNGSFTTQISNAFVVSDIPAKMPAYQLNLTDYPYLSDLPLSHCGRGVQADILIGMDNSDLLMPLDVRRDPVKSGQPYAILTKFGWSFQGPVHGIVANPVVTSHHVSLDNRIDQQVRDLWDLEQSDEDTSSWSIEDKSVYDLWTSEITHDDGHYILPVPWKGGEPNMPNNRFVAMKRLEGTMKRLKRSGTLSKYSENMAKMLADGYCEKVPDDELSLNNGTIWYLPHHGVVSDTKPGKIRIVFDCAAIYDGVSLNSQCFQGPDLNNKLLHVLLRFREYKYAVMADIEAMYHQVRVPPKDRNCMRFLWYENDQVVEYRMTSHLFGGIWCASSSTFALRQVVTDFLCSDLVRDTVLRSFYVDDLLKSVLSVSDAVDVITGTKSVLKHGGFNLAKFMVNSSELINEIPVKDRAQEIKEISPSVLGKALGILWAVDHDVFLYENKHATFRGDVTKRVMLSKVSSMYDPLGLVSPVVILGRMLFQEAVKCDLSWDQSVPAYLNARWLAWLDGLGGLSSLQFPRCVIPIGFEDGAVELHHFCDSSMAAYGACSYVRIINKSGRVHVSLLFAKARLAPLKLTTIPRLELCAGVTAVHLDNIIRRELDISFLSSTFWSDSKIVLAYIIGVTLRLKLFVANRVTFIREHTLPGQWRYIPSGHNPADVLSRGCLPLSLPLSWSVGPAFLSQPKCFWPVFDVASDKLSKDDPELKTDIPSKKPAVHEVSIHEVHPLDKLIQHYSSFYRLKKALCWLLRVLHKLRSSNTVSASYISVPEMKYAEFLLVKHVQHEVFATEISDLQSGSVRKSSSLYMLTPCLLPNGTLAVGGRLKHAPLTTSAKFPLLLPSVHPFTNLVLREFHDGGHMGTEWVLSLVRCRFWIPGARNRLKQIKRECITCRRLYAQPLDQKMADLPVERCRTGGAAFQNIGVDLFGPFYVKYSRSEVKRYGCVYTCFSTRAVHLEVLNDLSTDSFVNGFLRFCARRGYPDTVKSDNGTNMVGAQAELSQALRQLDRGAVVQLARRREVEWSFNPPLASHQGGVWERMIRTIRRLLLTTVASSTQMSDEVIRTVFCEVENLVNSRPITKCSDDVMDDEPLSPNHLLLLKGNYSFPWCTLLSGPAYRRKWRLVQDLVHHFWRRWLQCYLPELQKRHKWLNVRPNLKVGDLVLLLDQSVPRGLWPLALVKEVNVGRDGLVRSVRVRTKSTELVRPITKVVLLEASS